MSRSYYSKDWQNRKSLLIRSLFHDIPILSPVPEESNESSDIIQSYDNYNVVSRPIDYPRPYSPLPPLIIEKEPNRHDEPEEFYQKLLLKIKKIYRKLFIENLDLNSEEYDVSRYASSIEEDINDNNEISNNNFDLMEIDQLNVDDFNSIRRESSNSINNSKGYAADSESEAETNEETASKSDEEEISNEMMSDVEEEQSSNEMDKSNNLKSHNNERTFNVESGNSKLEQDSNEEKETSNINVDEEMESSGSFIDEQPTNDSEEPINANIAQEAKVNGGAKVNNGELEAIVHEDELKSTGSKTTDSNNENVEVMEQDIESNESNEGIDFRQVTVQALVHNDGSQDVIEKESRVYEDSEKSVILHTRKGFKRAPDVAVQDIIEEIPSLEEHEDPDTTSNTDESQDTDIEIMRTPRLESPADSIHCNTYCSDDSHRAEPSPKKLAHVTSLEHEIGDKTRDSGDINDVLTSIINNSSIRNDMSPNNERLARKRKIYEDTSAQTESRRVTWDELRSNFFVGTPKIFKLCSCVDHICQY